MKISEDQLRQAVIDYPGGCQEKKKDFLDFFGIEMEEANNIYQYDGFFIGRNGVVGCYSNGSIAKLLESYSGVVQSIGGHRLEYYDNDYYRAEQLWDISFPAKINPPKMLIDQRDDGCVAIWRLRERPY